MAKFLVKRSLEFAGHFLQPAGSASRNPWGPVWSGRAKRVDRHVAGEEPPRHARAIAEAREIERSA